MVYHSILYWRHLYVHLSQRYLIVNLLSNPRIGQVLGYIFRTINATEPYQQWSKIPYILQVVLPLVAPALFAASIYMTLGRTVEMSEGDKYLFIKRSMPTKIFVIGDIISFLMQGAGKWTLIQLITR